MVGFVQGLAIESWTLWAVGIFTITCRIAAKRIILGSFSKLQSDDYLMLMIAVTFTGTIITVNQTALNGSNYLPPGAAETLGPDQINRAIWGSKMTFALEECMLATIWGNKACLLILYGRLTTRLKFRLVIKLVAAYCAVGYITVQILFLGVWCYPIEEYWSVPVKHSQCATYYNHMITATAFNISSDLMIISIPIPLLTTAQLPLKRKLVLCAIFSLGIFVILTAILNRYFNFTMEYSPVFLSWYVGESATAVCVANIPLCWPLLSKVFNIGLWTSPKTSHSGAFPHASSRDALSATKTKANSRLESNGVCMMDWNESEERIMDNPVPAHQFKGFQLDCTDQPAKDPNRCHENGEFGIVKTVELTQYRSSPSPDEDHSRRASSKLSETRISGGNIMPSPFFNSEATRSMV